MNSDEIKTYATKIVIAAMTWLAARYLPADAGAAVSAYVPTIAAGLVAAGAFIYAAYRSTNMKLVPEDSTALKMPGQVAPPPVGSSINLTPLNGVAKVVGALLIGFLVLQAMPAMAQTKASTQVKTVRLTTTQAAANPLAVLQQFSIADLTAALADAQANNDIVTTPCWQALLTAAQAQQTAAPALPAGVFSAIQTARDLKTKAAAALAPNGPLAQLNVACAPLLMDANATLAAFGIATGVVVGTGGIALPALPGFLPLLLAPKP